MSWPLFLFLQSGIWTELNMFENEKNENMFNNWTENIFAWFVTSRESLGELVVIQKRSKELS